MNVVIQNSYVIVRNVRDVGIGLRGRSVRLALCTQSCHTHQGVTKVEMLNFFVLSFLWVLFEQILIRSVHS